jgi:hypothetical protein
MHAHVPMPVFPARKFYKVIIILEGWIMKVVCGFVSVEDTV